jgi:hypothetical protein
MSAARIAVFAILALVGCGGDATPGAKDKGSPGGGQTAARTWPPDAPSATVGCERHEDCTVAVWDGPFPPDPCCDARVGYAPVRAAYLTWMKDYRARACAGVTCPTPPFPGAEPACCAGHARCVDHTCVSACDDPTAQMPSVSVLDPACSSPPLPPPPP